MKKVFLVIGLLCLGLLVGTSKASALTGSDWQAGRIIDDSLYFNGNTMSPQEVQLFLNSKVPTCDTNGSQPINGTTRGNYGTSVGHPPPYICLKDYHENTPTKAAEPGLCGQYNGGNKSAAQIIYDVGVSCGVSQKAIVVLLQKEQTLITDDWPWDTQYRSATGYGCPDTAPCDTEYYGFFNQVYNAARQFRKYDKDSTLFRYRSNRDNSIQYSPNASCGSSNVYIQNQSTAGLYNYTPYQPNQAALNNLYGTGDACSAYGNRNFWRMYNDWFGTVNGPAFSWQIVDVEYYSDAAMTHRFTFEPTTQPGGKIYVRVKARNNGYITWDPSFIRLGTANPRDHISPYSDTSWPFPTRPAALSEARVEPSQTGTFEFSLKAPQALGSYRENFNLVAEGYTWMNDQNTYYSFNVVSPISVPNPSVTNLNSGESLSVKNSLIGPVGQTSLRLQGDGNLVLSQDYEPVWQTLTGGSLVKNLVMQTDGNLVLYDVNDHPLWFTGTGDNPNAHLSLQYDGNLVIYSQAGTPLWTTGSGHNPNYLSYVNTTLHPGKILRGQWLQTADRRYKMILQNDGNLVLYSPQRAIWATHTDGSSAAYLAMQTDGNLVLYDQNDHPLWHTATNDRGISALVLQQDGNLVVYQGLQFPTWDTKTGGVQ
jgi:hypothetical protein